MIRLIGGLIGLGFVGILIISMFTNLAEYFGEEHKETAEHALHREAKDVDFSFSSPLGKYDRAQLQRGFQVYKEVCAACHGLNLVAFRNLEELGYNEAEVKAIANQWAIEVPSINPDTGEASTRKALPADRFPDPYANETAARAANNNALPPDLSLIAKNREGGPHYVYSLLTGYQRQPAEVLKRFPEAKTGQGLHYNPYFANLNIAMPPPITSNGQVTYADGTPSTVDQMSKDVSAFLMWAAEPKLESRHRAGWATLIFLIVATILGYLSYRNIWATAKRKVRVTGPLEADSQAKSAAAKAEQGIAG
jgi:ubiquinol-cytochrome c reductase cytochrome c1 subunit